MPAPFLTIAVPTYNRLIWISKTLPTLLEQAARLPAGEIEILVSDNCSTDGTPGFLHATAQQHALLRLNRNDVNVGAEANCLLLSRRAAGRYLCMLGDDDLLEANALTVIYDILKREACDYLVLNFSQYDGALVHCVKPRYMAHDSDLKFSNMRDCMTHVPHLVMGYLSSWVGKKEFFNVISEIDYRHFSQYGMAIMADRYIGTARMPRGYLVARPLLRSRRAEISSFPHGFDYITWFLEGGAEVLSYAAGAGAITQTELRSRKGALLLTVGVRRIVYERMMGIFDRPRTMWLLFRLFRHIWVFWLLCLPAAYFPGLGKLARLIHRR